MATDAPDAEPAAEGTAPGWMGPVGAMLLVQTAVSFLSRIPPTLAPSIAPRVGWTLDAVGYLTALISSGSIIMLLLAPPVQRRLGPMRTLQVGLAFGVAGTLLVAAPSAAALVAGALIIGFSTGPPATAGMDVVQRYAPMRHRILLFSIKQSGVPLGGVAAGLMLPLAVEAFGLERTIWASALLAAAALALVEPWRLRVDAQRQPPLAFHGRLMESIGTLTRPLATIASLPAMRRLGIAGGCLATGQSTWFAFLVTYLVSQLEWSLVGAGALFALMQAISVLGRPLVGFISDRLADGMPVLRFMAVASALTTLAFAFCTPAWPDWSVAALSVSAGLTVASWNGVLFAEMARMAPREALGEAMAGATLLLLVAYVLAAVLFSVILAFGGGYRTAFLVVAAMAAAALWPLADGRLTNDRSE